MMKLDPPPETASKKDWALYYGKLGWPVIPLHYSTPNGGCSCRKSDCSSTGKHPATQRGLKDASDKSETIERWWQQKPDANIGVVTGHSSHLLVVDVDPRHGGNDSLSELEAKYSRLTTLSVETGGGGKHFYFRYPDLVILRNAVNIFPGIDIRAQGGYVVAPPSVHASGKGYAWCSDQSISEAPSWLISILTGKRKRTVRRDPSASPQDDVCSRRAPAIRHSEQSEVSPRTSSVVSEGARNDILASIAGCLRKRGLDAKAIQSELIHLNSRICYPPLPQPEVSRVALSIGRYVPEEPWPDLQPLPNKAKLAEPLTDELVPPVLLPWAKDIARRMQIPLEFVCVPAIVAIGSVIGRRIAIHPKQNDDWLVIPNLWGGIVARPGCFKSPAIAEALKPLEALAFEANRQYEQDIKEWELEKSIQETVLEAVKTQLVKAVKQNRDDDVDKLQSKIREIKNDLEEGEPKARRFKTNDATVEKIGDLLVSNPNGLLVVRDELHGWLASLGKKGREGDREFYLESWNGYSSFTVDRIGRGTIHIPALCLSMLGGIQPGKLTKYVESCRLGEGDDGLLQRFQLLIYPDLDGAWSNVDEEPNLAAKSKVESLLHEIKSCQTNENIRGIRFDEDSQPIFDSWREALENLLRSNEIGEVALESHLAKFRSLMPSLALIFEVIAVGGKLDDLEAVSVSSTEMAISWCRILETHARKVYKVDDSPVMPQVKALAYKIEKGMVRDGDSLRSIYRRHWSRLDTAEKIEVAANELSKLGWLRVEETISRTKKSKIVRINPELMS